ncbi:FUSC family protein [Nostoc ellipsosporum NOK]|nr:FUSC family protein [Nostoc ellipsosporum NOK]
MDYFKEYRSFVSSYYFAEGLRITAGVTLPAVILSYFNLLDVGLVVSLGAICVSASDIPGPILHRRNGMQACIILIFFVALLTGFVSAQPVALGIFIAICCFVFSMIGVYGGRVNAVGLAALLVMVLSIHQVHTGWDVVRNALYVSAGGLWYMLLSLALYSFRPYRLVQQALGESIMAIAQYLRTRAQFYNRDVNYDKVYRQVMEEQVSVQQKQLLLRDLLFKSRHIVKESTVTGRTLLMIFTDTVDLFEKTTTSFYAYETLHREFDSTDILQHYQETILKIADELDEIGLAVQWGRRSPEPVSLQKNIQALQEYFNEFRNTHRTSQNLEALISLRKILQSLEDISVRLYTLHHYTGYDRKRAGEYKLSDDYEQFVTPTDLDWRLLKDNLTLRSNTFRHALRVSIATTAGYILSHLLAFGHSYWILLTIIVILKPAYSLSRERNYQRFLGTVVGALVGLLVIWTVKDRTVLFVLMLILMTGAYSFMRTRYLVSVVLMTPYILIMFHLLDSGEFTQILRDRLIDTGIGSVIAFLATFLLVPAWEKEQMKGYMTEALTQSIAYYKNVSAAFTGGVVTETEYKLSRKNAFVALANLSGAFSRMLLEPRSKQTNGRTVHQFVVMSYMLNSHIATLSYFAKPLGAKYRSDEFKPVVEDTIEELEEIRSLVNGPATEVQDDDNPEAVLQQQMAELVDKRRAEIQQGLMETETRVRLSELKPIVDQFLFISRIAGDMKKVVLESQKSKVKIQK